MLPGGILATGTYTQTGGLLQFQLAPGGAGRISVGNTATLGGTLGVAVTPGLYGLSTQYTLLTTGAISDQFAQFVSSPPSAFLSLSGPFYDPTSVDVTVTRTPFGAVTGLSRNQRAVGKRKPGRLPQLPAAWTPTPWTAISHFFHKGRCADDVQD
jgi:hypothetical protein